MSANKKEREKRNEDLDLDENYNKSGEKTATNDSDTIIKTDNLVAEQFTAEKVNEEIERALEYLNLPYKLQKFQIEAIFHIVNSRNVILISPTGSGKMIIIYIALIVKQNLTDSQSKV